MINNQVFHSLLHRVGDNHAYQTVLMVVVVVLGIQMGASTFLNTFLFYEADFQCPQNRTDCQEYVCTLPPDEQEQYINQQELTLVSRFGNFRCGSRGELDTAQAIIYLGGTVGCLIASLILTCLTQRKVIIISVLLDCVGLTLTLFSQSLAVATVGLSFNFMGRCIQLGITAPYISECVSQGIRINSFMWSQMAFSIGAPFIALVYWLIRPWWLALLIFQLIPNIFCLLAFVFFLQETPIELVTTQTAEEAHRGLMKIARFNGVDSDVQASEVAKVQNQYWQNERKKNHKRISMVDLFCFPSLRVQVILGLVMYALISYVFVGPQLTLEAYSLNIYLNGTLIGSSEIVATFIGFYVTDLFPRKKAIQALFLTGSILCFIVFFTLSCRPEDNCSMLQKILQTACLFIFRGLSTIGFNFYIVAVMEIFPSQVRAIAGQLVMLTASLGIMVVPLAQTWFEQRNTSVVVSYGVVSLVVCLVTFGVRQTHNITPPQIIEELLKQQ